MGILFDDSNLADIQANRQRTVAIPGLSAFPELLQGFTTRFGGVSTGDYATFNLNFNRPDPRSNVEENYRLLGAELGVPLKHMVLSHQVHDKTILPVTKEHAGMGLLRERNFSRIDGLATSEKELLLITHYADCVPLYFYDPQKKVIALSHSGWKGTLSDIGGETVKVLKETYGCQPENLHMAFGPHIMSCCFEVDNDVVLPFQEAFPKAYRFITRRHDGKWMLDLQSIIRENLVGHGLVPENIHECAICTRCHKDIFFSHRGGGGSTGTNAAFMMMRG